MKCDKQKYYIKIIVELKDFIIKERENDIKVACENLKDYENTIYQFRTLVQNLQKYVKTEFYNFYIKVI